MGKNKGHPHRLIPKTLGGKIGLMFKVFGALVMTGPAIEVISTDLGKGDFSTLPNDLLFSYTGLGGTTAINTTQMLKGAGALVGGGILIYIGKLVSKMIH